MNRDGGIRMARKSAQSISELVQDYIREMKLSSGLNTRRIFEAWDEASGAAAYTTRRYFRDGRLYITLSSSVARSSLSYQKPLIMARINQILQRDELFTQDDPRVRFVEEIILK